MTLWLSINARLLLVSSLLVNWLPAIRAVAQADSPAPFVIQVVDEASGRGVPMVELETVNYQRFVTDNHGRAAILEPDLLGQTVFFSVRSHGYEFPKDGIGFRGQAIKITAGGRATLKIKRLNVAERLYRVTGGGLYRDTLLAGEKAPLKQPLLNAGVVGCDSVLSVLYGGQIHWFWGDTLRPEYPLGNFHTTGAVSRLPRGGLDPAVGIDFDYFVNGRGGVREMAQMSGDGPTWITSVTVLRQDGRERMYAAYIKVRKQLEAYRWGFIVWNDDARKFEHVASFDQQPATFPVGQVHTFMRRELDGVEYVYFCGPLPFTRVVANPKAFVDPTRYKSFTCLKPGTRPTGKEIDENQLERGADGRLVWGWKANTPFVSQRQQRSLVRAGLMKPDERRITLRDAATDKEWEAHTGSVAWNEFRKRWVLIAVESGGDSSFLGEVWFAEADEPTGPWCYARKIVTHDKQTFYNPKHHPFFDQDGGRRIFFEGTYTHTFSGNPERTPRYEYNQMMYGLDLAAAELNLPVAMYGSLQGAGIARLSTRQPGGPVAFFALERPAVGAIPIVRDGQTLHAVTESKTPGDPPIKPLCYAIPHDAKSPPAATTPLYEFVNSATGQRAYSTHEAWQSPGFRRTPSAICRVWKGE